MESCPQACSVVADSGGLQPNHRKGFGRVPPCWVTGPKGLMRAGGLQQVRWGGKSGTARKERDKDNEGGKTEGTETEGTRKDRDKATTRGKNGKGGKRRRKKKGVDEQRGGRPGGRGGEAPRWDAGALPCWQIAWPGLAARENKGRRR